MNSVDKVKNLCRENKVAISKLERDLGFANGYISQLRKGVFPTDRAVAIANYFNVPLGYITGESEQKEKPTESKLGELIPGYDSLSEENKVRAREYIEMLLMRQQIESP